MFARACGLASDRLRMDEAAIAASQGLEAEQLRVATAHAGIPSSRGQAADIFLRACDEIASNSGPPCALCSAANAHAVLVRCCLSSNSCMRRMAAAASASIRGKTLKARSEN